MYDARSTIPFVFCLTSFKHHVYFNFEVFICTDFLPGTQDNFRGCYAYCTRCKKCDNRSKVQVSFYDLVSRTSHTCVIGFCGVDLNACAHVCLYARNASSLVTSSRSASQVETHGIMHILVYINAINHKQVPCHAHSDERKRACMYT
jgi:hypothetical protein